MHALSTHVRNHPEKWNEAFDLAIWGALGADITGSAWSLQAYGDAKIPWTPQQDDLRRFFAMLASLHSLHRSGQHALIGARVAQYPKAVKILSRCKGSWAMAWPMTDLPEPIPRQAGLHETSAHPAEYAAVSAYVREQRALEEALRRGGANKPGDGDQDRRPWWQKRKDKDGKDKGGAGETGAGDG